MTREPFVRLALIAAAAAFLVALVAVAQLLGWVVAFATLIGAVAAAYVLTLERDPEEPTDDLVDRVAEELARRGYVKPFGRPRA